MTAWANMSVKVNLAIDSATARVGGPAQPSIRLILFRLRKIFGFGSVRPGVFGLDVVERRNEVGLAGLGPGDQELLVEPRGHPGVDAIRILRRGEAGPMVDVEAAKPARALRPDRIIHGFSDCLLVRVFRVPRRQVNRVHVGRRRTCSARNAWLLSGSSQERTADGISLNA